MNSPLTHPLAVIKKKFFLAACGISGDEVRRQQDGGASAVEYGLLIAAVTAVIAVTAFSLGSVMHDTFARHLACFVSYINSSAAC